MHALFLLASRALLRLYPRHVQSEIGDDLLNAIERRANDRRGRGLRATFQHGSKELLALAAGAVRVHGRRWSTVFRGRAIIGFAAALGAVRYDVPLILRGLRRTSRLTLTVLALFAVGIGGASAVFSVVDGAFVRPLPYARGHELVTVWNRFPGDTIDRQWVHDLQVRELRRHSRTLQQVAAVKMVSGRILGGRRPLHADVARVSANFFALLEVEPYLGRFFEDGEDEWGAKWKVVLSYEHWLLEFGGDPEIVGKQIKVGWPFMQVIGVLPPDFSFVTYEAFGTRIHPQLWIPHQVNYATNTTATVGTGVAVIGRLAHGSSVREAQGELATLWRSADITWFGTSSVQPEVRSLRAELTETVRPTFFLLSMSVGCVLLAVIANVSILMCVRTEGRRAELSLRSALGASRGRLLWMLFVENLVLALIGGMLGSLLAVILTTGLVRLSPLPLTGNTSLGVDTWVVGFATLTSVLSAVAASMLPVRKARGFVRSATSGYNDAMGSRPYRHTNGVLVSGQIALSVLLVVCAALATRSLIRTMRIQPGFEPDHALTFSVHLMDDYIAPERQAQFYRKLVDRIRRDPDVIAAGGTTTLPLKPPRSGPVFRHPPGFVTSTSMNPGQGLALEPGYLSDVNSWMADHHAVTDGYFRSAGMRMIEGRDFTPVDGVDGPPVVIVDQAMADSLWPVGNPIGGVLWATNRWRTVVGIVAGSDHHGLGQPDPPQVYYPLGQVGVGRISMVVKSRAPQGHLEARVREAVAAIDSLVPIGDVQPLSTLRDAELAPQKFLSTLLVVFAVSGALIALAGLFAVLSHAARCREREAAIRHTLGSSRYEAARVIVVEGMRLALTGTALGIAGLLILVNSGLNQFIPTQQGDTTILLATAVTMHILAFVSSWIPARKAIVTDPVTTLVSE